MFIVDCKVNSLNHIIRIGNLVESTDVEKDNIQY